MSRLLRGIWRTIDRVRRLILNALFLVVLAVIIGLLVQDRTPGVPDGGALVVAPTGALVDQRAYVDPLAALARGGALAEETLLSDLVQAIELAARDDRIRLLVLQLDGLTQSGLSKAQELGQAISRFRASGKPVVAVGDSFSQDQYWIAAQADRIFLNPMGAVLLEGYGIFNHYLRDALDRLAVRFHVFRVGTHKAAVEPLLRNDMSDEAAANNRRWLGELWDQYRAGVIERRSLPLAALDDYVLNIDRKLAAQGGNTAQTALASGLVDELKSRREVQQWLIAQVGADADGAFRGILAEDYLRASRHLLSPSDKPRVGVIVASGMILDGEQQAGVVGGDSLASLIEQARLDDEIKAVVLRVDSEGGSAFASEIIRQELLALKAGGKPLVVSMGSVAASGGYWIAANADRILATPATITGSIGIFGVLPSINETLARWGIYSDGVGTTPLAGSLRIDRPLEPAAARAIQASIEHGYQQFVGLVADGRGLPVARVENLAQGRIWAGSEAVGLGLVDQLGTLSDAIAVAARLAGLERYHPEIIEPPLAPGELLLRELSGSVAVWIGQRRADTLLAQAQQHPVLSMVGRWLDDLVRWNDPNARYVYCFACARL